MSVRVETTAVFENVNGLEVTLRDVSGDDAYSGCLLIEFDGCSLELSEDDVQDLRTALDEVGY